ncbi:MAG: hypothetical protein ACRCVW_06595 [Brevinema sp.]
MRFFGFFLSLTLFGMTLPTHAYLDPNSGSGLVAFVIAILAGLAFYGKKIFYALKNKRNK